MAAQVTAPTGFRLRTWEYPKGTVRRGLVCNGCGYVVDPSNPATATSTDLAAAAQHHVCPAPIYEWDFWHRHARARGVDPELAELGRAVYREAYQHAWGARIDEESMIRSAKRAPRSTARRWAAMLEADAGEEVA